MAQLTPVERGVLIAMAASGGRMRENADINVGLGLSFRRPQREKLSSLGFIEISRKGGLTHSLTDRGWDWVQEELSADRPEGRMGLGAMYGLMHGLDRALDVRNETVKSFFTNTEPSNISTGFEIETVANALCRCGEASADASDFAAKHAGQQQAVEPEQDHEADVQTYEKKIEDSAWADAEGALALALQDMASFHRTMNRAADPSVEVDAAVRQRALRQVELAADQVFQSVRRAAARRDLMLKHERGETVAYDAVEYESDFPLEQGENAIVVKSAVVRASGDNETVIVRGIVDPC